MSVRYRIGIDISSSEQLSRADVNVLRLQVEALIKKAIEEGKISGEPIFKVTASSHEATIY